MKKFDDLPKSVKKVVRYIYQDATIDQLEEIEKHIQNAIKYRLSEGEKRYE